MLVMHLLTQSSETNIIFLHQILVLKPPGEIYTLNSTHVISLLFIVMFTCFHRWWCLGFGDQGC